MTTLANALHRTQRRQRAAWIPLLFATDASPVATFLRVTLALVLLPHGAQHLLGAFGGYGFQGTLGWMTGTLGIPAPLAAAGILLEFFGPLLLLAGFASRLVGAALAVFMATAGSTHVANGFFMNWVGSMPAGAEGFEFHILAVAIGISVAAHGGGALSLDRVLAGRLARNQR